MIIDESYFRGEITIAQLSQATVLSNLDTFISKYEPRFLKQLLGLSFYNAFIDGIDPISGAQQRWLDLLNGVEYEYNDRLYEWVGFQNTDKLSPIANFVYYQFTTKQVQWTVGTGEVKPKNENSTMVSATPKLVRAWNEMVEWNHSLLQYLDAHKAEYPEWKPYTEHRWWFSWNGWYDRWYGSPWCDVWPDIYHLKNTLGI